MRQRVSAVRVAGEVVLLSLAVWRPGMSTVRLEGDRLINQQPTVTSWKQVELVAAAHHLLAVLVAEARAVLAAGATRGAAQWRVTLKVNKTAL